MSYVEILEFLNVSSRDSFSLVLVGFEHLGAHNIDILLQIVPLLLSHLEGESVGTLEPLH